MRNILCFNYFDQNIANSHNYPGGRDNYNYIYIIFELEDEYIDDANKKVYKPYDGFMKPLDKFSTWDESFKMKVIRHCERKLSGFGGEVWIDDVRIK